MAFFNTPTDLIDNNFIKNFILSIMITDKNTSLITNEYIW